MTILGLPLVMWHAKELLIQVKHISEACFETHRKVVFSGLSMLF
jgi:hypothetical protein